MSNQDPNSYEFTESYKINCDKKDEEVKKILDSELNNIIAPLQIYIKWNVVIIKGWIESYEEEFDAVIDLDEKIEDIIGTQIEN